jgi:hypothetical protein
MDEVQKQALKIGSEAFKAFLEESPGRFDEAQNVARDRAVGYYVCEKGLDVVNTKSSVITAEWRKDGWWPPRSSREVHWVDFFSTLSDRVDQGRSWDYLDEAGSFKRRPNAITLQHEEIIEKIKEIVPGARNLNHLVGLLNERNVLTIRSRPWSYLLLKNFCDRWMPGELPFKGRKRQQAPVDNEVPEPQFVKEDVDFRTETVEPPRFVDQEFQEAQFEKPLKENTFEDYSKVETGSDSNRLDVNDAVFALLKKVADRYGTPVNEFHSMFLYMKLIETFGEKGAIL